MNRSGPMSRLPRLSPGRRLSVEPEEQPLVERDVRSVIGECAVYGTGGRQSGRVPFERAGHEARRTDGFVWIGLQQPTEADIAEVAREFRLPPLAVEDATEAHQRPKVEVYDDVVFVVLKPVDYIDHDEVVEIGEIAMFLGRHFVVTVRHGRSTVLRGIRDDLDHGRADDIVDFGPAAVLYRAADRIVDGYEAVIEDINVDIDEIENAVFGPGGGDHAERIYKLKREVAEFRRAVLPLTRPLQRFVGGQVPNLPEAASDYFRDVFDHLLRSADSLEQIDRQLTDILQANSARVTTAQSEVALRQNEDMRKISAWAALALVPTAVAGIYGMNFDDMPELHTHYGYYVVIGGLVLACSLLYWMFRRNHWL